MPLCCMRALQFVCAQEEFVLHTRDLMHPKLKWSTDRKSIPHLYNLITAFHHKGTP